MIERKSADATSHNRCIIKIMGDDYVVKGKDDPEYMKKIAAYVETTIMSIAEDNQKLNKCQVAVLAALKLADELHKIRQEY